MHMLDLHCHYLPGVDDGARTLDEGLALVRAAVANGIDRIVLTPHIHPGRYENTSTNLATRFENFRRAVESAQIPVQLALAGEARLCDELLLLLESGKVPLLESAIGAQTLLLELPHSHVPAGCFAFLRWLQRRNIAPLLVHPERNKELMAHPHRLQKLREAGCMIQVTAAAIIGSFGARAQQTVNLFLEKSWVDLVASDAHNLRYRPPLMREAYGIIARRYGEKTARQLCEVAPYALTAGNFAANKKARPATDTRIDEKVTQQGKETLHINVNYGAADAERDDVETLLAPSKTQFAPAQTHETQLKPAAPEPLLATSSAQYEMNAPEREIIIAKREMLGVNAEINTVKNTGTPTCDDVCDSALDRMRSELLRRAAEPNIGGVKAARILQLMNALQAS